MTTYANLRAEATGFVTDWLAAPNEPEVLHSDEFWELDRGARIIEAQMHEIDRLQRLVREAHRSMWEQYVPHGAIYAECSCDDWVDAEGVDGIFSTLEKAKAAHAAHVEAILNGEAP